MAGRQACHIRTQFDILSNNAPNTVSRVLVRESTTQPAVNSRAAPSGSTHCMMEQQSCDDASLALCRTVLPATSVDRVTTCHFTGGTDINVLVAKRCVLEVYRLVEDRVRGEAHSLDPHLPTHLLTHLLPRVLTYCHNATAHRLIASPGCR